MADDTRASFSKKSQDMHLATGEGSSPSYLDEALNFVLRKDSSAPSTVSEGPTLEGYAKQFVKAVPLFLAGRTGLVGSALLYAADQMHSGASLKDNALGGSLGLAQGATLKLSFDAIGARSWNPAGKGIAMGLAGRTFGTFLDSQNWKGADGSMSVRNALSKTVAADSDGTAIAADALIFAGSYGVMRKLGAAGYGSITGSRLIGNTITGTVFGASSGAFQEAHREIQAGNGINPAAIARESLINAAITGAASVPGAVQSSIKFHQSDFGSYSPAETAANRAQLSSGRETTLPIDKLVGSERTDDWSMFQQKNVKPVDTPVRTYGVAGTKTEIVIPRSYDDALRELRSVRDVAAQPLSDKLLSDPLQTARVAIARMKLDLHPMAGGYLPEDLVPGIQQVPDSNMMPRVFALDTPSPYDAYRAQAKGYDPTPVLGQRSENGDVVFFKPTTEVNSPEKVLHEWSHSQQSSQPIAFEAFANAAELERYGYYKTGYAKTKTTENWAEHSESLLGQDKQAFAQFVHNAPIRAAVLGRALGETLANTAPEARSAYHDQYQERVDWIAKQIEPKARQELLRLGGINKDLASHSNVVLDYLNGKTRG